jgi:hypothetical protein
MLVTMAAGAQLTIRGGNNTFQNQVTITIEGDFRVIRSNGIPNHPTGQFPGRGNPNTISPQKYEFRVMANPKPAAASTPLILGPFGIAVNGVLFDPGADEWWNGDRTSGWQYEPLKMAPLFLGTDSSHAHVQPNGAYHYHGIPTGLLYTLTDGKEKMVILGWAADGFPIYNNLGHTKPTDAASPLRILKSSYRVKPGQRPNGPGGNYDGAFVADYEYAPNTGDLDESNGIFGPTPEYPNGIYHYVLTDQFPYIPRQFHGTPDKSFMRGPGGGRGPGGRRGPGQGPPNGGFHLIPPFAEEPLNLTNYQRQKITPIEGQARKTLETILTPDQLKTLKETRPPRGGPGGAGERDGGNPRQRSTPPRGGIHLIPPFAVAKLNLTDSQEKQIAEAQAIAKEQLAKILTPEQLKTLEEARPPQGDRIP